LKLIYKASDITQAHIISGLLESNGIDAHVGGYYLHGGEIFGVSKLKGTKLKGTDLFTKLKTSVPFGLISGTLPVSSLSYPGNITSKKHKNENTY